MVYAYFSCVVHRVNMIESGELDTSSWMYLGDSLLACGIENELFVKQKMEDWDANLVYKFISSELGNEYTENSYAFEKFKIISGPIFKALSKDSCISLSSEQLGQKVYKIKEERLKQENLYGSLDYNCNSEEYINSNIYFDQMQFGYTVDDESFHSNTSKDDIISDSHRKPGRPRNIIMYEKTVSEKKKEKLWEFIISLLNDNNTCPALIRWENIQEGTFKFVQNDKVAQIWGNRKKNTNMTYEKFSRAMRYYYKSKILLPVPGQRLVYKFGPQAKGWQKQE